MTLLLGAAIRSSLLLACGLLLHACLSKRSAALRHRVLAAALLAAASVTPLSLTLPAWTVTLPARAFDTTSTPPGALPAVTASPPLEPQPSPGAYPARGAADPAQHTTASVIPIVVWLAGALAAASTLLAGTVRVRRAAGRAVRVEDQRWIEILDTVAARYGLTRRIGIVVTESPELLATWGIIRPKVLLPRHARHWTLDRLHVVLCHELAHIRRHDWVVQMGAEAVRVVFWFNPLAWIVCSRLRRESEQACDDEVLCLGVAAREYAGHLLELARACRLPGRTWASALPMAHPSTLERRIAAMLNPRLDRRAPSPRALATLVAVLLVATLPVAALRARQAGPAPLAGTVYDVTGSVLPGVEVRLVDANQIAQVATTNASGRFEFPVVAPGTYELTVALVGFRTLRQELDLQHARDWDRAITLQVGQLQETVTVSASRVTPAQPSSGIARGPIRVGGSIRPPRKTRHVRPIYPPSMREAGLTGVVPLEAIIGRDGSVSHVRVLSAQVHPDFAIAAVDAVRQWQFTPTLLNGAPVEVMMTVTVDFSLQE